MCGLLWSQYSSCAPKCSNFLTRTPGPSTAGVYAPRPVGRGRGDERRVGRRDREEVEAF